MTVSKCINYVNVSLFPVATLKKTLSLPECIRDFYNDEEEEDHIQEENIKNSNNQNMIIDDSSEEIQLEIMEDLTEKNCTTSSDDLSGALNLFSLKK